MHLIWGVGRGEPGHQAGEHAAGRQPAPAGEDLRLRVLQGAPLTRSHIVRGLRSCSTSELPVRNLRPKGGAWLAGGSRHSAALVSAQFPRSYSVVWQQAGVGVQPCESFCGYCTLQCPTGNMRLEIGERSWSRSDTAGALCARCLCSSSFLVQGPSRGMAAARHVPRAVCGAAFVFWAGSSMMHLISADLLYLLPSTAAAHGMYVGQHHDIMFHPFLIHLPPARSDFECPSTRVASQRALILRGPSRVAAQLCGLRLDVGDASNASYPLVGLRQQRVYNM